MKYNKLPTLILDQIKLLKERGLKFEDEAKARSTTVFQSKGCCECEVR
jgi:hypothetical protein